MYVCIYSFIIIHTYEGGTEGGTYYVWGWYYSYAYELHKLEIILCAQVRLNQIM